MASAAGNGSGTGSGGSGGSLRPDWSGFSPLLGTIAVVLVAGVLVGAHLFGAVGLFAGMGVLQSVLAVAGAPLRVRPWAAFWFAAVGVGTTALAGVVAQDHRLAVSSVMVVAFLAACGLAIGPVVARMTNVMAVWFLAAAALLTGQTDFGRPALGFLCGSAAVFALLEVLRMARGIRLERSGPHWKEVRARLAWGSPALTFALVFAISGAVALEIGWRLLPENRVWPAMTALVLIRPVARESLAMSAQRLAGTLVGVGAAVAVIGRIGDPRLLILMALVCAFMQAATLKVDYAVFAVFLTGMVVALATLGGKDPVHIGNDRILATAIGAAIAVAATAVLLWAARRRDAGGGASGGSAQAGSGGGDPAGNATPAAAGPG